MVIQYQPGVTLPNIGNWADRPEENPDLSSGLEYLAQANHIFVKQKKEIFEIISGWEVNNKYEILNSAGQQIYYTFEENDCFSLQCCGKQRGFTIHIVDNSGREVIQVNRDFRCCAGSCEWCAVPGSCCAHQITVEAPPGNVIGSVTQRVSCCIPSYQINDHNGESVLNIDSPDCCNLFYGCGDKVFTVTTMDDSEIGFIRKEWSDIFQELFTNADNFGVSFPMDLSVKMKATLIGATFLIQEEIQKLSENFQDQAATEEEDCYGLTELSKNISIKQLNLNGFYPVLNLQALD